jgi:dCMP deaminase
MPPQHKKYIRIARTVAGNSDDPDTKVGAVITQAGFFSVGCNSLPNGVASLPHRWTRPLKYLYVVHAEINALAARALWGDKTMGANAYLTLPPCLTCAGALIQAGVKGVYYPMGAELNLSPMYQQHFPLVQEIFKEAGVVFEGVEE